MKGDKKILVAAVLLLLLAVSFGTYAIYRTSVSGTASVSAAHWSAVIKKGTTTTLSDNFALTMSDFTCTGGHGQNDTIAPGDTCKATITADLDGSEVNAKVGVTIDDTSLAGRFTASLEDGEGTPVNGEVAVPYSATSGEMETTFKVVLTWAGDSDSTKDAADVQLQGTTVSIPITISAHQDMGS